MNVAALLHDSPSDHRNPRQPPPSTPDDQPATAASAPSDHRLPPYSASASSGVVGPLGNNGSGTSPRSTTSPAMASLRPPPVDSASSVVGGYVTSPRHRDAPADLMNKLNGPPRRNSLSLSEGGAKELTERDRARELDPVRERERELREREQREQRERDGVSSSAVVVGVGAVNNNANNNNPNTAAPTRRDHPHAQYPLPPPHHHLTSSTSPRGGPGSLSSPRSTSILPSLTSRDVLSPRDALPPIHTRDPLLARERDTPFTRDPLLSRDPSSRNDPSSNRGDVLMLRERERGGSGDGGYRNDYPSSTRAATDPSIRNDVHPSSSSSYSSRGGDPIYGSSRNDIERYGASTRDPAASDRTDGGPPYSGSGGYRDSGFGAHSSYGYGRDRDRDRERDMEMREREQIQRERDREGMLIRDREHGGPPGPYQQQQPPPTTSRSTTLINLEHDPGRRMSDWEQRERERERERERDRRVEMDRLDRERERERERHTAHLQQHHPLPGSGPYGPSTSHPHPHLSHNPAATVTATTTTTTTASAHPHHPPPQRTFQGQFHTQFVHGSGSRPGSSMAIDSPMSSPFNNTSSNNGGNPVGGPGGGPGGVGGNSSNGLLPIFETGKDSRDRDRDRERERERERGDPMYGYGGGGGGRGLGPRDSMESVMMNKEREREQKKDLALSKRNAGGSSKLSNNAAAGRGSDGEIYGEQRQGQSLNDSRDLRQVHLHHPHALAAAAAAAAAAGHGGHNMHSMHPGEQHIHPSHQQQQQHPSSHSHLHLHPHHHTHAQPPQHGGPPLGLHHHRGAGGGGVGGIGGGGGRSGYEDTIARRAKATWRSLNVVEDIYPLDQPNSWNDSHGGAGAGYQDSAGWYGEFDGGGVRDVGLGYKDGKDAKEGDEGRKIVHLGTFIYPKSPFPYFFPPPPASASSRTIANANLDDASISPRQLHTQPSQPSQPAPLPEAHHKQDLYPDTQLTLYIPSRHLPLVKPERHRIWGGGIPARHTFPGGHNPLNGSGDANTTNAYNTGTGTNGSSSRIYTDDSDVFLCALHSGWVTWSGARKARVEGRDLRVEVRIVRCASSFDVDGRVEAWVGSGGGGGGASGGVGGGAAGGGAGKREGCEGVGLFLGGWGERYRDPTKVKDKDKAGAGGKRKGPPAVGESVGGVVMKEEEEVVAVRAEEVEESDEEDDGRLLVSAGWGSTHDGSGIEILKAEFVEKGTARGFGLKNRTARLAEYAKRRAAVLGVHDDNVVSSVKPVKSMRKRKRKAAVAIVPHPATVAPQLGEDAVMVNGTTVAKGVESDEESDEEEEEEEMRIRTVVFGHGEETGYKFDRKVLEKVLFCRPRKRRRVQQEGEDSSAPSDTTTDRAVLLECGGGERYILTPSSVASGEGEQQHQQCRRFNLGLVLNTSTPSAEKELVVDVEMEPTKTVVDEPASTTTKAVSTPPTRYPEDSSPLSSPPPLPPSSPLPGDDSPQPPPKDSGVTEGERAKEPAVDTAEGDKASLEDACPSALAEKDKSDDIGGNSTSPVTSIPPTTASTSSPTTAKHPLHLRRIRHDIGEDQMQIQADGTIAFSDGLKIRVERWRWCTDEEVVSR